MRSELGALDSRTARRSRGRSYHILLSPDWVCIVSLCLGLVAKWGALPSLHFSSTGIFPSLG